MARSRVELFEQIRRDRRVEKLSIRELADRHRVHRRTVRQALANAIPPPRKAYPPRRRSPRHIRPTGRPPAGTRRRSRDQGVDRGAARPSPAEALITATSKAIEANVLDPQVVLIDARRVANGQVAPVIPIGMLTRYDRPAPTLIAYDDLLTGSGR